MCHDTSDYWGGIMLTTPFAVSISLISMLGLGTSVVCAQNYPNKPIRIVTSNIGGGSDFTARLIAQGITGPLGQPVIVENRPSGIIPAEIVSKAPADGYTLYLSGSNFWIGPLLQKTPYDPVRDFSPISLLVREVYIVAVHPSVPVKSVKELIDLAKPNRESLTMVLLQ